MLKKIVLDKFIAREITRKSAANLLQMHPNAVSRLKSQYKEYGIPALVPNKPGPKPGETPYNRTNEEIEDIVVALGLRYPQEGPDPLSNRLWDEYTIKLEQTTVWRILKRKGVRYTREYKRWKKDPKFYCLDKPGKQLQMDGCYPYGRQRDLVQFDAIDDCSRWVLAKLYEKEDADSAIAFVIYLIPRVPFRIESIRVDNRYGERLKTFCEALGIEIIENDPYAPKQNGKIERFHKTVKREFYWRYCGFNDSKELIEYKLNLWLAYYNNNRRHRGYGMNKITPREKIATTLHKSLANHYPQNVTGTLQSYKIYKIARFVL